MDNSSNEVEMKMKKIGLFVLCVVFILLFGYTICSFGSSEIYSFDSPKNLYSEDETYVYNEKISEAYQVTVYGSPYGEFMESSAGRATKNGKKGEYQFLGYNFEEKAITNDRWFTEASNKGKVFSKNYSDVEWVISNPEAVQSWTKINSDPNLIKHITTSKFYDCDHVTLGVTDTGKTIIDLLGADYQDYAILLTDPSTGDSAHIKLHYKRHGYTTTITAKRFNNSITDNYLQTTNKEMYWTSEPYYLNVIRWMYHMDKDNNLYNPTAVDGQYKRPFTQQCSANIEWGIKDSMEQKYKTSKRNSENAVFATDKAFSHIAYPIRSGFYFNPCGEYEFTVETVTYKTTRADTKDHKDLVDALINSFRYETDMMFIDKNKNAVNLQNELLPRSGNSYARKSASLTAQDPTGVDGVTMLTVLDRDDEAWRYYKTVEELYHSQHENGDTHKALKEILEGYAESGTAASNQQFKYKEYIKDGQHIYKITERTTVTIRINHQNLRVYTHPHMPNGKYTVKAWLGDIDLSGMSSAYNRLGVYKSLDNLENIEVTVVGSMYNDINR